MSLTKKQLLNFSVFAISALFLISLNSCQNDGCTDPSAFNYDPQATRDDGSCIYPPGGGSAGASDTIESDITSSTTITENTYMCGKVQVTADLTIEPGVTIVFCSGAKLEVNSGGSLNAVGTSSNGITFKGEVETEGYWDLIEINSNNPDNVLKYVTVQDGGGEDYWNYSMIYVNASNNAKLKVENSTFKNSQGYGLYAESGTELTTFSNNTFNENGTAGLRITASLIGYLDSQTDYDSDNSSGESYIEVSGNDINSNQTWPETNAPLYLTGKTKVFADITVQPGATVLFGPGAKLEINSGGSFNAEGTSSNGITFKGEVETHGHWDVIQVNSNNPDNVLKYVTVQDGGGEGYWDYSMIYVDASNNGQLTVDNSTIKNSSGWGMYVESGTTVTPSDSSTMVSQNTFSGNGQSSSSSCTGNCDVYFQ